MVLSCKLTVSGFGVYFETQFLVNGFALRRCMKLKCRNAKACGMIEQYPDHLCR